VPQLGRRPQQLLEHTVVAGVLKIMFFRR
jgi:hypothetical protein